MCGYLPLINLIKMSGSWRIPSRMNSPLCSASISLFRCSNSSGVSTSGVMSYSAHFCLINSSILAIVPWFWCKYNEISAMLDVIHLWECAKKSKSQLRYKKSLYLCRAGWEREVMPPHSAPKSGRPHGRSELFLSILEYTLQQAILIDIEYTWNRWKFAFLYVFPDCSFRRSDVIHLWECTKKKANHNCDIKKVCIFAVRKI